jgi:hypothetical protein
MTEWSEEHMVAIGPSNLNLGIYSRFWIIWRPDGTLRWKMEIVCWESRGGMWQAGTSKVVGPACVG